MGNNTVKPWFLNCLPSRTIEEVEKLLLTWIEEKQLDSDSISETMIYEKVKMLQADLLKDTPGKSAESDLFN